MWSRRVIGAALALLSGAQLAAAQTTTLVADRLRLNTGPCVISSSNGSPDKLVFSVCPVLTTAAATNLTLNPTGDLVLGPTGADILPDAGYTQNLGALSNKYLTLHAAELWVETLVAQNTIATIGGRVLVAPTTTLTADLAAGATSIAVKHNNLANGDRVYMEADGKVEWMAVTSGASGGGPYTYSVTRNLDGSGANQWYAGDAVLNTGTTGKGYIDLYSLSGVLSGSGPTIAGNVRTGTTYNQIATRWAVGNLNGLYGYGAETYGFAAGDPSATNITADSTNGFRIRHGTTNKMAADTSGNLALTGDLSVGASGVVRSSTASGYSTGDGFWLEGGSTPRFRIGNPSGNQLTYDAGTGILSLTGNGSGLTSIGPGSLTVGTGRNMIRNSDCAVGTSDWTFGTNSGQSFSFVGPSNLSTYRLNDIADNTCYFSTAAAPTSGTFSYAYTSGGAGGYLPVVPGRTYEASAYVGTHRATRTFVAIQWFGVASSFTYQSENHGNNCTTASGGGVALSNWCRSLVIAEAPAGAYNARVLVYQEHSGETNPYALFVHTYFGEAFENQTEATPWAPAGATEIIGGMIKTSTITADKLTVSSLSAISANIGTITAGTMSGVTATFGGGAVTLNSNGVTLTAGNGDVNKVKWSGGSTVYEYVGSLNITSGGDINLIPGSGGVNIGGSSDLVLGGTISKSGWAGGGTRAICVDNNGDLFRAAGTSC